MTSGFAIAGNPSARIDRAESTPYQQSALLRAHSLPAPAPGMGYVRVTVTPGPLAGPGMVFKQLPLTFSSLSFRKYAQACGLAYLYFMNILRKHAQI